MPDDLIDELSARHRVWSQKPVLRSIYADIYRRLLDNCTEGSCILEVGGGTGVGKNFINDGVSLDIIESPWTDLVADCHALPFSSNSLDNVVLVDVLHHLHRPVHFLNEASRTLRPGGRIVMVEPAVTALSYAFYKWLHYEPLDMSVMPLSDENGKSERNPLYDSNQAIPTLLFERDRVELLQNLDELQIAKTDYFSLWAYPLSGGYRPWSLLPSFLVEGLLKIERRLEPWLAKFCGFRMIIVLEKDKHPG
ncbi:MAG: class I SAM-dependent methyltransferase [Magnetovibrio sp.]|nr:class I SAM-dependent methyltransferase [Magnetovibrio sp.]